MHRRATVVLLAVLFVAGFAACSDTKDKPTLTTVVTTTTTAPPPTTPSLTAPSGPAASPDAASLGLFNAWKRGDRDDASHYAKPEAITKLFAHPYTNDGTTYDNQGCSPRGGQFVCSWTYPGGVLQMTVEAWPGGGFVVDSVTYIAD